MSDCIFCKIAKGEIDLAKIYEDDNYVAILDLNPNTDGMTLVMPKKHFDSYAFEMPDKDYEKLMLVAKKVGQLLDKKLGVKRTALVTEGMGVNHAHVKLYPMHGLSEKFRELIPPERVFFEKYQGYLSTKLGPKKDIEELKKLADKIRE